MSIITEYLEDVDKLINQIPYCVSNKLQVDNRSNIALYLKGKMVFVDSSELHFKEYFLAISKLQKLAYSYHYHDRNQELIFRFDNAEHHPEIQTYPHHKHLKNKTTTSREPLLQDIINDIQNILLPKLRKQ